MDSGYNGKWMDIKRLSLYRASRDYNIVYREQLNKIFKTIQFALSQDKTVNKAKIKKINIPTSTNFFMSNPASWPTACLSQICHKRHKEVKQKQNNKQRK